MKKALLLSIALVLTGLTSFAQWEWQNPLPQGNPLNSVCFPDANTGYAAGELGTILKTMDGGANWTVLSSGTTLPLNAVCFTDANTGYAVGGKYNGGQLNITTAIILKTTDGGGNWTSVFMSSNIYFSSVFFTDANTGYAVGYGMTPAFGGLKYGIIYKTSDGGTTWNLQYSGPVYNYYNSVYFFESNTGYVVGSNGTILITNDAGATWNAQSSGVTSVLNSIFFTDANTGIVLSNDGIIMKTTDGGATWIWVWDDLAHIPINSVYFTDANTGYAMGGGHLSVEGIPWIVNIILKTIDGGTTWNVLASGTIDPLFSVYFTDEETGYAVGDAGTVLKTTDGGTSWIPYTSIPTLKINSVHFTDAITGYAAGSNYSNGFGALLKTTDGGANWAALPIGSGTNLYSINFADVYTGFAVGNGSEGGTILKTFDGGSSWTANSDVHWGILYSVYFTDALTGYVVGYDYRGGTMIIRTSDGGITWNDLPISTTYLLSSVYFTNANTGYIVGGPDGIIYKTIDGGINWTSILSGSSYWLNSVCFTDSNTGYAVGCHSTGELSSEGGLVLKTVNGGTTWMEVYVGDGSTGCLNSVHFSDPNTGFVAGNDGTIIKTIDAGTTWTDIYSGTTNSLYSAFFTDANTGYVAGEGGTILKTTNGGGTVGISQMPVGGQRSAVSSYPNPFVDHTTFEYTIEESGSMTLEIFNQVGQREAILVNEFQTSGTYQVQWNAQVLPAGIYYYSLRSGTQTQTGKLIIVK